MSVKAISDDYRGEVLDAVENFHGNQLLFVGWDDHLMFCAPLALALPPETPFRKLTGEILADAYGYHPDWARVDWSRAEWLSSGEPFAPDPDKTLAELGLGHKACLRLRTPGLTGIAGSSS